VSLFFFVYMFACVVAAVKVTASDQALKEKYGGLNLSESDLIFRGSVLRQVLGLGFGGGWVAGALGLGGGVIYNPLLMAMGVPPKVSSSTGMFLVMFSTISTSGMYLLFGRLIVDYGLWIAAWSCVGSIIGLKGANWYMRKYNRQSLIVFVLTFMLMLSTVCVPLFGANDLKAKS
jgi:uncharacterized membrane protein YfcA